MLDLPWADADLMLQAQQTWADRHARGRPRAHRLARLARCRGHDPAGRFDARACFDADYRLALDAPHAFPAPAVAAPGDGDGDDGNPPWHARDVHPAVRIPAALTAGPWPGDDAKQRRLFWLLRAGGARLPAQLSWELVLRYLDDGVIRAPEPSPVVFLVAATHLRRVAPPREAVLARLAQLHARLGRRDCSSPGRAVVALLRSLLADTLDVGRLVH